MEPSGDAVRHPNEEEIGYGNQRYQGGVLERDVEFVKHSSVELNKEGRDWKLTCFVLIIALFLAIILK